MNISSFENAMNWAHSSLTPQMIAGITLGTVAIVAIAQKYLQPSIPTDVRTIYTPKTPHEFEKIDLNRLKREHPNLYCLCKMQHATTRRWENAYISYREIDHIHHFEMHTCNENTFLGFAKVYQYGKMEDSPFGFGSPALVAQMERDCQYGHEKTLFPKIFIENMYNRSEKHYKSVGYHLAKGIIQKLGKQVDYRVDLSASYTSHTFWYGLGFRSSDEEVNKRIASAAQNKSATGKLLGQNMFLTDKARDLWQREIEANPLLVPELSES